MATNNIGLNKKKARETSAQLNNLLANYQLMYQNLRGFHWNIRGSKFFELHLKFEELYTDINLKIDEIAERILALEDVPLHTFSEYIKNSKIKEVKGESNGDTILRQLVSDYTVLITQERKILKLASENDDEGTVTLMSDYITLQEKTVWMLKASLG